jgi:hypothetical protein
VRVQDLLRILVADLLKHLYLEGGDRRFCDVLPDIVTEEEETTAMYAGLGNIKVAPNKRD